MRHVLGAYFRSAGQAPKRYFTAAGIVLVYRAQFADCLGAAATTCHAQNTAPLGAGPYRIIDFKANEQAGYERNPFYRGPSPYFDRVVLRGGGDAISAARAVMDRGAVSAHLNTLQGVRINGWDSELWNIAEWRR